MLNLCGLRRDSETRTASARSTLRKEFGDRFRDIALLVAR